MTGDAGATEPYHLRAGFQESAPKPEVEATAPVAHRRGGDNAYQGRKAPSEIDVQKQERKRPSHASTARFKRDIAQLTGNKSLANCGRKRAFHSSAVTLACDGKHATALGIMLCKNSHLCPGCAPWLARRREEILAPQLALIGGLKVFVTLTIERHRRFTLRQHNRALDAIWRATISGAPHRDWVKQSGGFSFVRGFETGYSPKTGWGGHFHMLGVLHAPRWPNLSELGRQINRERRALGQKQLAGAEGHALLMEMAERRLMALQNDYAAPVDYLMKQFTTRFRKAATRQGVKTTASAQDWQIDHDNRGLAYVVKGVSGWNVLAEVIGGSRKKEGKMLSFWELADEALLGRWARPPEAPERVKEYATAMKGRRMITVSRDLKLQEDEALEPPETEMAGLLDMTDEGLERLRSKKHRGVGLAILLDRLPHIWQDDEAIHQELGPEGLDLVQGRDWMWHIPPGQDCEDFSAPSPVPTYILVPPPVPLWRAMEQRLAGALLGSLSPLHLAWNPDAGGFSVGARDEPMRL